MSTLRGIFPTPKTAPKRDFLKENKLSFKKKSQSNEKVNSAPGKIGRLPITNKRPVNRNTETVTTRRLVKPTSTASSCSVSVQTSDIDDDKFLKDTIIRYPSAHLLERNDIPVSEPEPAINEPEPEVGVKSLEQPTKEPDEHTKKIDRKISDLTEFLEKGSISTKSQQSRCKELFKPTTQKRNNTKEIIDSEPDILEIESNGCYSDDDFEMEQPGKRHNHEMGDTESLVSTRNGYADSIRSKRSNAKPEVKPLPANYKIGEVPKYLRERKDQLKQTKLQELKIDPQCPVGHIALSENERLDALAMAKSDFKVLVDELNKMPMTAQTFKLRNRKMEIEKELDRLENSIRIFSRKKVYVKIEDDDAGDG